MDVYLLPVGPVRYEPYCEVPDDVEDVDEGVEGRGFFSRMRLRFREMLADAERERRQPDPERAPTGWLGRVKAKVMRWVVEAIAEQRLLWHLRKQTAATLHYPDDLPAEQAMSVLRGHLQRDYEKHRFWLIVDGLLTLVLGVGLFFVPGPNLIAYYFTFRFVGHYLALAGAKQGLRVVQWHPQPSPPLSELRRAMTLAPDVRERQVAAVAERLRLEHLPRFFERSAAANP
jgi:hypothetical protein